MKRAGRGSIINISSIEGMAISSIEGMAGTVACHGYTTSKFAIFQTALGRAAEPVEVSHLVVYLASDESGYSTGSEFIVDGGCTAGLGHEDFSAVEADQATNA